MGSTCTIESKELGDVKSTFKARKFERSKVNYDQGIAMEDPYAFSGAPLARAHTRISDGARLDTYPNSELGQKNPTNKEPIPPVRRVQEMNTYSQNAQKRFQAAQRGQHSFDQALGVYAYQNGNTYNGQYRSGLREGIGEEITPNGDGYNGEWRNDMKHGRGVMVLANGDHYVGDFFENRAEGNGVFLRLFDGEMVSYNGEFKNGVEDGQGTETYPDGSNFKGGFLKNSKNGQGTFTFKDGSTFRGSFEDDIITGHGKCSIFLINFSIF